MIGSLNRRHDLGRHRCGIVAGEVHADTNPVRSPLAWDRMLAEVPSESRLMATTHASPSEGGSRSVTLPLPQMGRVTAAAGARTR